MSNTFGENPGIVTDTAAEYDLDVNHEYAHLDDLGELTDDEIENNRITLYVFDEEDRMDELRRVLDRLRGNYILATGIEWPAWLEDDIEDMDAELLTTLEWMFVIKEDLSPNDVDYVKEAHELMDVNGGDD